MLQALKLSGIETKGEIRELWPNYAKFYIAEKSYLWWFVYKDILKAVALVDNFFYTFIVFNFQKVDREEISDDVIVPVSHEEEKPVSLDGELFYFRPSYDINKIV